MDFEINIPENSPYHIGDKVKIIDVQYPLSMNYLIETYGFIVDYVSYGSRKWRVKCYDGLYWTFFTEELIKIPEA